MLKKTCHLPRCLQQVQLLMIKRSIKESWVSLVRMVKRCPYDDPGGTHPSPVTMCNVKFISKDPLGPGMFRVSSLPRAYFSLTFHYLYLRRTHLIIHLAIFFAQFAERTRRFYDIRRRESGVVFRISNTHDFIMQAAYKIIRWNKQSRHVLWFSLKRRGHHGNIKCWTSPHRLLNNLFCYVRSGDLSRTKRHTFVYPDSSVQYCTFYLPMEDVQYTFYNQQSCAFKE
jgi:hypothetical protein